MKVYGGWRRLRGLWLLAVVLGSSLGPEPAWAQAQRIGATFSLPRVYSDPVRFPATAFDPLNRVYLVVTGNQRIQGQFVREDGSTDGSAFLISQPGYAQHPRLAYSPDAGGFLVSWHLFVEGTGTGVFTSVVRYGAPPAQTSPQLISGWNTASEFAPPVAYSTVSREFLVAWQTQGWQILGRKVDNNGVPTGGVLGMGVAPAEGFRDPSLAYNPVVNEFLAVYSAFSDATRTASVYAQRIAAGQEMVHGRVELTRVVTTYATDVAFNPSAQIYVATWNQNSPGGGLMTASRVINSGGTPIGAVVPLLAWGSSDAASIASNGASGSFFFVTHGVGYPDVGMEISAAGVPGPPFEVTPGATRGNFYPRVGAHSTLPEWLVVTSNGFLNVDGQRVGTSPGGGTPPPPPPPPPPTGGPVPTTTLNLLGAPTQNPWFFAEGNASTEVGGFDTFYLLVNENDSPVTVRAHYAKDDGQLFTKDYVLPRESRTDISLKNELGQGPFSAVFQSLDIGRPVYAGRSVFWGVNFKGNTSESATPSPGHEWYFAEASRKGEGFHNFFLVFNPNPAPASVRFEFFTQNGSVPYDVLVGPRQRYTLAANDPAIPQLGLLADKDFSVKISSASPVVAERAMYFANWQGGHASLGARSPGRRWLFAEGAAGPNFGTFYLVLNPNDSEVVVDVTYLTEHVGPIYKEYRIPPRSRATYLLNVEVGEVGGSSAQFVARNGDIVVERSIYWGNPWLEATNVVGATSDALTWYLSDGSAGPEFDEYVLVGNPNNFDVQVELTIFTYEGPGQPGHKITASHWVTIPRLSRKTMHVRFDIPLNPGDLALFDGKSIAVRVASKTPGGKIIVEEALYRGRVPFSYWRTGGASFGVPKD